MVQNLESRIVYVTEQSVIGGDQKGPGYLCLPVPEAVYSGWQVCFMLLLLFIFFFFEIRNVIPIKEVKRHPASESFCYVSFSDTRQRFGSHLHRGGTLQKKKKFRHGAKYRTSSSLLLIPISLLLVMEFENISLSLTELDLFENWISLVIIFLANIFLNRHCVQSATRAMN